MSTKRLYRESKGGRLHKGWVISTICFLTAVTIIAKVPPTFWWVEVGVVTLIWLGMYWAVYELGGRKKWGLIISGAVVVLILLRRLDWLSPVTFGVWLAALGLISLTN